MTATEPCWCHALDKLALHLEVVEQLLLEVVDQLLLEVVQRMLLEVVDQLLLQGVQLMLQQSHFVHWRSGDLLLVDNWWIAHGRLPFTGERIHWAAMGSPPSS